MKAERRHDRRLRTLKGATISFDRAAGIDCIVRNVSAKGACLDIASPVGIPESFELIIHSDKMRRSCRVAWRTANRIGVRFT